MSPTRARLSAVLETRASPLRRSWRPSASITVSPSITALTIAGPPSAGWSGQAGRRIGRGRGSGASDDLTGHSDGLTQIGALGIPAENWPDFLAEGLDDAALQTM